MSGIMRMATESFCWCLTFANFCVHPGAVAEGLKYAASHEWVKADGEIGIVGISDFAQVGITQAKHRALRQCGSRTC